MARFYVGQKVRLREVFVVKGFLPNHRYLLEAANHHYGPVARPCILVGADIAYADVHPPLKEMKLRLAAWCERMAQRLRSG